MRNRHWNKKFYLGIIAASISAASGFAHGHGEDKPGPNGGFIRMPGAFHTELVQRDGFLEVYLLDIQWKNPVTSGTKLEVFHRIGETTTPLVCRPVEMKFRCTISPKTDLKKGELLVRAERLKSKGSEVVYKLPLSYLGAEHQGHNGH